MIMGATSNSPSTTGSSPVRIYIVTQTYWRFRPVAQGAAPAAGLRQDEADKCIVSAHTTFEGACAAAVARIHKYMPPDSVASLIKGWNHMLVEEQYQAMLRYMGYLKHEHDDTGSMFRVENCTLFPDSRSRLHLEAEGPPPGADDAGGKQGPADAASSEDTVEEVAKEVFLQSLRKNTSRRVKGDRF